MYSKSCGGCRLPLSAGVCCDIRVPLLFERRCHCSGVLTGTNASRPNAAQASWTTDASSGSWHNQTTGTKKPKKRHHRGNKPNGRTPLPYPQTNQPRQRQDSTTHHTNWRRLENKLSANMSMVGDYVKKVSSGSWVLSLGRRSGDFLFVQRFLRTRGEASNAWPTARH